MAGLESFNWQICTVGCELGNERQFVRGFTSEGIPVTFYKHNFVHTGSVQHLSSNQLDELAQFLLNDPELIDQSRPFYSFPQPTEEDDDLEVLAVELPAAPRPTRHSSVVKTEPPGEEAWDDSGNSLEDLFGDSSFDMHSPDTPQTPRRGPNIKHTPRRSSGGCGDKKKKDAAGVKEKKKPMPKDRPMSVDAFGNKLDVEDVSNHFQVPQNAIRPSWSC